MPKTVLTDAYVSINSVDLSHRVQSVELDIGADAVEQTAMGDGTHNFAPGLQTAGFNATFHQDFAAGSVDATLSGVLTGGVVVAVEIRPKNTTVGSTNPKYTGNFMLETYNPIAGTVGQEHVCKAGFKPGGSVSRATS